MVKDAIDTSFTVKEGTGKGTTFKVGGIAGKETATQAKVMGGGFFSGTKSAAKAVGKGIATGSKVAGRGIVKGTRFGGKIIKESYHRVYGKEFYDPVTKTYSNINPETGKRYLGAKQRLYNSRIKSLERKQNIAVFKSNIANERYRAEQAKTTRLESKLQRKDVIRNAKLQRQLARQTAPKRANAYGLKPGRSPLSDRVTSGRPGNLNKSNGGFFAGVSKKPLSDKGVKAKRKGGFFG